MLWFVKPYASRCAPSASMPSLTLDLRASWLAFFRKTREADDIWWVLRKETRDLAVFSLLSARPHRPSYQTDRDRYWRGFYEPVRHSVCKNRRNSSVSLIQFWLENQKLIDSCTGEAKRLLLRNSIHFSESERAAQGFKAFLVSL
jgi:hypothetical protein